MAVIFTSRVLYGTSMGERRRYVPTLSYRGERSIEYPAHGHPYNTLPPPPFKRRDIWGVGTVSGRTLAYPVRFKYLGNRGEIFCVFRDHTRKRFYKRNVLSETRTRVLDDFKCGGVTFTELGVKDRSITQPRAILRAS